MEETPISGHHHQILKCSNFSQFLTDRRYFHFKSQTGIFFCCCWRKKIFEPKIIFLFSYCEDDRYQKQDRNCWNGDSLGDYTHKIMDMHSQKYNPEVPMEADTPSDSGLHKINDQLITIKNLINKQVKKIFEKF